MLSRRDYLKLSAMAGAAAVLPSRLLRAMHHEGLIKRAIPKTGEEVPIIGLGSSATFRKLAGSGESEQLAEVIATLLDGGGTVFDTAPSYGAAEEVSGRIVQDQGAIDKIFWATKVNVAPRGGVANPDRARAQIERSFDFIGKDAIDLIQVHNVADVPTQLAIIKELKEAGRIRYIGVTSTDKRQYAELASVMRNEPIDFIGIDYAVDNRLAAEEIFPICRDRGIGVLVYLPFGRTRLWNRVGDRQVPEWASEAIGVKSWAQFFIKFAAAHPAVTAVTPATSKPHHMLDNLGAGVGALPDRALQKRMADFVDALPAA
ncbi:aldo/keto reductase [Elongatibacter sediminis]|uniref:Aldo/keto reductase n=1 Tax=Elongatibacter sediminis TaxID=3119006 RepID=A0AAW9RG66_9GAMM